MKQKGVKDIVEKVGSWEKKSYSLRANTNGATGNRMIRLERVYVIYDEDSPVKGARSKDREIIRIRPREIKKKRTFSGRLQSQRPKLRL